MIRIIALFITNRCITSLCIIITRCITTRQCIIPIIIKSLIEIKKPVNDGLPRQRILSLPDMVKKKPVYFYL